jgi:glycosyltransferase involved in cell wall biosynthesis
MISLICTVFNEGRTVRALLDSLLAQSMLPDEVVIVDGGSSDDTVDHIRAYESRLPLRLIVQPGANISQGRNRAIAEARGDIIAITDAGVTLHPTWLEAITRPLREQEDIAVSSGFFVAAPWNALEMALGATTLPDLSEIDPQAFLPSSRSLALRKSAWEAVGGYPEWLDYCEDLIFDFEMRKRYGSFAWAPTAIAEFRPRSSLRDFFKQYYRYARGDGKADLWRRRHAIRYGTYLVALPALAVLGARHNRAFWLLGLLGAFAYVKRPYTRLMRAWERPLPGAIPLYPFEKLMTIPLVPIIRVIGDVAKMLGYPVGLWWRWKHRAQIPPHATDRDS